MAAQDKPLNRQQQAINDYLQALLQDVGEEPPANLPVAELPVAEVHLAPPGLDQLVAEIPEIITETETETEVELQTEVALRPQLEEQPVVEEPPVTGQLETVTETPVIEQQQSADSVIPDWAEYAFQCLLFKVSGLTLAVPLVKLNSVIPWSKKIVETPNQTSWYLGLVNTHGKNVKVIDTALMVLPENRRHMIAADPEQRFSHILLVDNYTWGLACDEIGDVIWLSSKDVKWRRNKQQRAWLAGTAIEQMCALIDTEVFADMLNRQVANEN